MPNLIIKRDGKKDRFRPDKITDAIEKAAKSTHLLPNPRLIAEQISSSVIETINQKFNNGKLPSIEDIDKVIIDTSRILGYEPVSKAYEGYNLERARNRKLLEVWQLQTNSNTTDTSLMIESDSKDINAGWDRPVLQKQIEREYELAPELAKDVSKKVENIVLDLFRGGIRKLRTRNIRELTDLVLMQEGLSMEQRKYGILGIPFSDYRTAILSKSKENSNVSVNSPEAINLFAAEAISKQFAIGEVFSQEVSEAHLNGEIHLHDLGYITRAYCSSHSLEYIKKFGLNKLLSNLESKSNPPNSAVVLNQHVQTFLASLQANYAGALGFGFLNILYAPLLNRPVELIKGKINGNEWTLEKRDLEKLIGLNEVTLSKEEANNQKKYFETLEEKTELREVPYNEFKQVAQNLIFASSQNAFSRGGQTLFIDFNIHTGIPHYLKNVPVIGPGGEYMIQMPDNSIKKIKTIELIDLDGTLTRLDDVPRHHNKDDLSDPRNGDADSSQLRDEYSGGKILTYGDFEKTSQTFAKALLEVWRKGDKDGRPFHFPKCDLHIDKNSYSDPEQEKLVDLATRVASENGSVYFMFDRGDGAVLAQCCRLKEKITDSSMLKYPEKLRFCGFQNVTINLAQAAYKGKTLENTLEELDKTMDIALKAHLEKKEFIQKLLDSDGSPLRGLGKPSDDGLPYIDLQKATYIIGNSGLNEAVQAITGKQLHESYESYKVGQKIIAHMYNNVQEFKKKTGLKFTLEESPAESATRRFAKIDFKQFEDAKKVIKGTKENPYYTNSVHFAPDAPVSMIDRIVGQSKFHDMIESGSIVHAYVGEKRPDKDSIKNIVKKTLDETRCSQLVFSPTYTECDKCGNVMPGEKELCTNTNSEKEIPLCPNSSPNTVDKDSLFSVTRVVGYYSRIHSWNGSQQQINQDRKKAENYYAGEKGIDISWLYNPNSLDKLTIMQFGKEGCLTCENLKENVNKKIKELNLEDKVDFKMYYLNRTNESEGLVQAALYNVPLDTVPTLVITGKNDYWMKTTRYAPKPTKKGETAQRSDLIRSNEIGEQLTKRIQEYKS